MSGASGEVAEAVKAANYEHLTQPERAQLRARYVEAQSGNCQHCGTSLDGKPRADIMARRVNWRLFPRNFLRWPVHLHHCHRTGMTIGAVHALCNAVLWQFHGE